MRHPFTKFPCNLFTIVSSFPICSFAGSRNSPVPPRGSGGRAVLLTTTTTTCENGKETATVSELKSMPERAPLINKVRKAHRYWLNNEQAKKANV